MLLDFNRKPVVLFDPSNSLHRKDYAEFLVTGSWRHSKVQYAVQGIAGEQQGRLQRQLLEYYTAMEFAA